MVGLCAGIYIIIITIIIISNKNNYLLYIFNSKNALIIKFTKVKNNEFNTFSIYNKMNKSVKI